MTVETTLDRRAARSRDLLLDALRELMCERGFERLTTQNIIDRAGVGRATFYAHFDNKEELLAASVGRLRTWLEAMRERYPAQPFAFMLPFFDHLTSHRALYRTTFERESEVSVERLIRAMMRELVRAELLAQRTARQDDAAIELATQFVVSTFWSVTVWWMSGAGGQRSPAEVNAIFLRLAQPGLELALSTTA
ncbi:TetR/AcrR family transcriptional regulator [Scleromatobacter humisilvae]|uniref:TetR/AcrR family transcriptional regulator n=1 Tax=Scleromatobacter humisilvae TaxID=2897159 RepID=A0A9X1YK64_9BURK|nr:TetR/AcrR family transcriptional regulator [Scleromatobacter humisilvae]MCK9687207.1 TetR/AcrR family transcriptional regulator [Scleromatobacter humisilvae]